MRAKGSGAYGTFTVTHDITKYTRAAIFSKVGKQIECFVRFSTVAGERGAADAERDIRGFDIKFYTEEGNWDFWTLLPESLHQVTITMSPRGIPYSYRHMNGYGSHTYSFLNAENKRIWVKFHLKTMQGIKCLTDQEAKAIIAKDRESHQRDLYESIEKGDYPKWKFQIQLMTEQEADNYRINPFGLTKVWPHNDFPLQGRLFDYGDAQRYRLGVNSEQIPVNRPRCPFHAFHRDGAMRVSSSFGENLETRMIWI